MHIATQLLITTLMTTPATTGVPDLCDVVNAKTGVPTICQVHKEGAPVYDGNVCCASGTCSAATGSACRIGELYYCELGAEGSTGEVTCYFEVPTYCDVFACELAALSDPQESYVCCNQGICWNDTGPTSCELNDIYWCASGASNADGTVSCFEDAG